MKRLTKFKIKELFVFIAMVVLFVSLVVCKDGSNDGE